MAGKANPPEVNRRRHFTALVAGATTSRRRLLALCQWLTALAWEAGAVDSAAEHVWDRIQELDPAAEKALKEAQRR